jgi:hypothetical protein
MKSNPETTYYFATPYEEGYMELTDDADLPFQDTDKDALMARLEECKESYHGPIVLVEEKVTVTELVSKETTCPRNSLS